MTEASKRARANDGQVMSAVEVSPVYDEGTSTSVQGIPQPTGHWARLIDAVRRQEAVKNDIAKIYDKSEVTAFDFTIRQHLGEKLDVLIGPSFDETTLVNEEVAKTCLQGFIDHLAQERPLCDSSCLKTSQEGAATAILDTIRQCLQCEDDILNKMVESAPRDEVMGKLIVVEKHFQEYVVVVVDQTEKATQDLIAAHSMSTDLEAPARLLTQHRELLIRTLNDFIIRLQNELLIVHTEIKNFRKNQMLHLLGMEDCLDGKLDRLNDLCSKSTDIILGLYHTARTSWETCTSIQLVTNDEGVDELAQQFSEIVRVVIGIRTHHFSQCLVIDNHPALIHKVEEKKKGALSRSLDVGISALGSAKLFSASELPLKIGGKPELYAIDDLRKSKGEFTCRMESMTYKTGRRDWLSGSGTMILARYDKAHKVQDKLMTDNRYIARFSIIAPINGNQVEVQVETHPLIFVSHNSQRWHALGLHLWSACIESEEAPWSSIAHLINLYCNQKTKKNLSTGHLDFLRGRLQITDNSTLVKKDDFLKKHLPRTNFSLWRWIWCCFNSLSKNELSQDWKQDVIHGFISHDEADTLLRNTPLGTFLVRFRETKLDTSQSTEQGCNLCVCISTRDGAGGAVKPRQATLNYQDLQSRPLSQYLKNLQVNDDFGETYCLTHLYPDRPLLQLCEELENQDGYKEASGYYYSMSRPPMLNLRKAGARTSSTIPAHVASADLVAALSPASSSNFDGSSMASSPMSQNTLSPPHGSRFDSRFSSLDESLECISNDGQTMTAESPSQNGVASEIVVGEWDQFRDELTQTVVDLLSNPVVGQDVGFGDSFCDTAVE